MGTGLQVLLAGTVVFTLVVLLLALAVLGARRVFAPSGVAVVRINGRRVARGPLGSRLLSLLMDNGVYLPAACGGRGACGQCRVEVVGDAPPWTAVEVAHLTAREVSAGVRLACMLVLREDLQITVPEALLGARRWACQVQSSRCITTLMKEIVLRLPTGEQMAFEAGSYVLVEAPPHRVRFADFDIDAAYRPYWQRLGLLELASITAEPALRAYSLANPPAEGTELVLTVRIALPPPDTPPETAPGQVSSWLFSLVAGDSVLVSGPFGAFRASDSDREMVLIGGGAGIAPMRSIILDQLEHRCTGRRISFWYGARNLRELCYRQQFDALAARHGNFRWHAALSEPEPGSAWQGPVGFIHDVVRERFLGALPAPEDLEYYVCGPPLMNVAVIQMLEDLGVDRDGIYLDDFGEPT